MKTVFVLQHARSIDDDFEDAKLIGVFSSGEEAQKAVDLLKMKPGFSAFPDGFYIDSYEIDKIFWGDGFGE